MRTLRPQQHRERRSRPAYGVEFTAEQAIALTEVHGFVSTSVDLHITRDLQELLQRLRRQSRRKNVRAVQWYGWRWYTDEQDMHQCAGMPQFLVSLWTQVAQLMPEHGAPNELCAQIVVYNGARRQPLGWHFDDPRFAGHILNVTLDGSRELRAFEEDDRFYYRVVSAGEVYCLSAPARYWYHAVAQLRESAAVIFRYVRAG